MYSKKKAFSNFSTFINFPKSIKYYHYFGGRIRNFLLWLKERREVILSIYIPTYQNQIKKLDTFLLRFALLKPGIRVYVHEEVKGRLVGHNLAICNM